MRSTICRPGPPAGSSAPWRWAGRAGSILAEPDFARALELAAAARDPFRRYVALGWRGEARLRTGRLEAARADLEQALRLAEQIGSGFHRGGFGALLAEAQPRAGALEEALRTSEVALAEARRAEARRGPSLALRARAEALAPTGRPGLDVAIGLARAAIAIRREQGLACDLAGSRLALARLLRRAGEPGAEAERQAAEAACRATGMVHEAAATTAAA